MKTMQKTTCGHRRCRRTALLLALLIVLAAAIPSVAEVQAESFPGVTTKIYHPGETLDQKIAGLTREKLVDWLSSRENDDYYIGTPYPELANGTGISGATGDYDWRNPNGDCAGINGKDDYAGKPMMNCTGFVWHALYKASGQSYDSAWANIPCYGDPGVSTSSCGRWALWLANNSVEYKAYWADSTQHLLAAMSQDPYLEKGDIIWFWNDSVSLDDNCLPRTHSGTHHIGFFWGDETNRDLWWDSIGISAYTKTTYLTNKIGNLDPKVKSVAGIVIKLSGNYKLQLRKESSHPGISENNGCYSLSGAVYGVYTDASCTIEAGRLTTGEDGVSGELSLPRGTYYVKEISAPKGFFLNGEVYEVALTGDYTLRVKDVPGADPVRLLLKKVDAETGKVMPLGGASLQGAEYVFRYYDVDMDGDPAAAGKEPKYEWVLLTDENGEIYLNEDQKISGPDLLKNEEGDFVLPLGTVTIRERKASEGYLLDEELYVVNTRMKNNVVTSDHLPNNENRNSREPVCRGDFSLRKLDSETQKKLAGVSFEITAFNAAGDAIETHVVTTDANGFYSSANSYAAHDFNTNSGEPRTGTWFGVDAPVDNEKGALPYGKYSIREIPGSNNAGHEMYEDSFEIYADKVVLTLGNIEDRRIPPEIRTTATDGSTGNHSGVISRTAVINDVIRYRNLPLEELIFEGHLVDAASGEPLLNEKGERIISRTACQITETEGEVSVRFVFDSRALAGRDVVVFENVLDAKGRVIASHEESKDPSQTVHYPSVATSAMDGQSRNKLGTAASHTTIIDTVDYQNLVPGETYRICGTVVDKATGEAVPGVTAEAEFVPKNAAGRVELQFEMDTSGLAGHSLVIFEKLYVRAKGNAGESYVEVAVHEDLNATAQTVTYREPYTPGDPGKASPAKTGDGNALFETALLLGGSVAAMLTLAVVLGRRKRRAGKRR